jgi:dihydroorotase
VLAFLNIVSNGMNGGLEQTVDQMDVKRCAETIRKYADVIVGVKTAHYWTDDPWDAAHPPWAAVDRAEECAQTVGLPVMFDFWPRPERTYAELILEKMRPGDIHTLMSSRSSFPLFLPMARSIPSWPRRARAE